MSETDTQPIDAKAWASLEGIADGDLEFLSTLIEQYLVDSNELVSAIAPAVEAADAEALARASHTLKSASANLGAMVLTQMAEQLCAIARSGSLDEAEGLAAEACAEYARVRTELSARLEKLGGAG
ncbi:MAG: Hpt domain-containing protein [Myxococcota bacterium]|jgi:HPt (histidine-containing phosphotransfer) domain-containing protein|nr:Hpt domain-containing protein [Myxococcota bacterium]